MINQKLGDQRRLAGGRAWRWKRKVILAPCSHNIVDLRTLNGPVLNVNDPANQVPPTQIDMHPPDAGEGRNPGRLGRSDGHILQRNAQFQQVVIKRLCLEIDAPAGKDTLDPIQHKLTDRRSMHEQDDRHQDGQNHQPDSSKHAPFAQDSIPGTLSPDKEVPLHQSK